MLVKKFIVQAERVENNIALKTRNGEWTYGQLLKQIHEMTESVYYGGLHRLEPIGVALPNSVEFIRVLFANRFLKHPSVLLGTALKPWELRYHVENAGIRRVFASPALALTMREAGAVEQISVDPFIDCWQFRVEPATKCFLEDDFIYQLTSGTNGIPKAAVRTEEAVLSEVVDTVGAIRLTREDVVLTIPPIHHSYGLIGGTLAPLYTGSRLVLLDGFIPAEVVNVIEAERVTILFAVPFMYHLLNRTVLQHSVDFSSLRLCLSAGAPMSLDIARAFYDRFNKVICQDYGSTETGVICLNLDPEGHSRSVGVPVGNKLVRVFDEDERPLPTGSPGGIKVKSNATARAYLYPRQLNEIAFHDGWYDTGDLGYVDLDGYVYVSGRKSSLINVAGLKVDPVEVENVIAEIPGVKEVAVVGVNSHSTGQVVKAVVVTSRPLDEFTIVQFCKQRLAHFKVPRIIEFMKELPRSATGKVLRKYLAYGEGDSIVYSFKT